MKKWLWNIVYAMLLLLAIATAGLWARSQFWRDEFSWQFSDKIIVSRSENGRIEIYWNSHFAFPSVSGFSSGETQMENWDMSQSSQHHFAGFGYSAYTMPARYNIVMPHWFIVTLFAFLPILWLYRHGLQPMRSRKEK